MQAGARTEVAEEHARTKGAPCAEAVRVIGVEKQEEEKGPKRGYLSQQRDVHGFLAPVRSVQVCELPAPSHAPNTR